jgi:site-specific DNA-methyltransferase (adenine-specific)/modification methylase
MSRHQIIFGGNYFDGLGPTTCWLIWDKQNGENDFADCEMAWTNLSKAVRRIYWRWNGMIRKGDDVREHPTQKPIGVMEWCIQHLPADANTILDPFMGSGTTGVACVNLGRKFTGIELDPQYFDVACRRIEEAYKQPRLFEEPAPKPVQEQIRFDGDAA